MESNVGGTGANTEPSVSASDVGEVSSGVSDRPGGQKLDQEEKSNPPKQARSLGPLAEMLNQEHERRNEV
jgi:hypothetical protein